MNPDRVTVLAPRAFGELPAFKMSVVEHGIPIVLTVFSIVAAGALFAWFASGKALGVGPQVDITQDAEPWSVRNNRRRKQRRCRSC
jgi:hypothetical protein